MIRILFKSNRILEFSLKIKTLKQINDRKHRNFRNLHTPSNFILGILFVVYCSFEASRVNFEQK